MSSAYVKFELALEENNVLVKNAIIYTMQHDINWWNSIIYGQLLASPTSPNPQALLVGANEDMITMMLLTAKYTRVESDDDNFIILNTTDLMALDGTSRLDKISGSDTAKFRFIQEDDTYGFFQCVNCNSFLAQASYSVDVVLKKVDSTTSYMLDSVTTSNWRDSMPPASVTRMTIDDLKVYTSGSIDEHEYTLQDLRELSITVVDVSELSSSK